MYTRREVLMRTGSLVAASVLECRLGVAADSDAPAGLGVVAGQMRAAQVGNRILSEGGNAIDAAVAAALVAGVIAPNNCGIGGYGGHMVIALAGGRKITAIDFNSMAPSAAKPDMFRVDDKGAVPGRINEHGWLAAGVPGTLAGLQFALDRYGTRKFRDMVAPAIAIATEGFPVTAGLAGATRSMARQLQKDAASARLLLKDGQPLDAGATYQNPDLARMLATLAKENSVESFYRGEIGRRIAAAFAKNGGLVSEQDMAAYEAREVEPLELTWRGLRVCTAPLTAGGLTVLQALSILRALEWDKLPAGPSRIHALIETLRVAWKDRLELLGDPATVAVPVERLLSSQYAGELAAKVDAAVRTRKPIPLTLDSRQHGGTIHLNSADRHGNAVALTLTHGNAFGACVTVDGLGLTLGHGMSRFDPQPSHPNSPGPGKRPLHNMCPTIVLRDDKPVLALGATGGRLIPSCVFSILAHFAGLGASAEDAVVAPRLHTQGDLGVVADRKWADSELEFLKAMGYTVKAGNIANAQAIAIDASSGACCAIAR